MSQELNELHQILFELYQKNLTFLKENYVELFEKIENMSKAIESGEYEEKYSLEMHDGYFDIKNLENGGFYYAMNSYNDAQERTEKNDYSTNFSWNLLRQNSFTNQLLKSEDFQDVLPIVDYINAKVDLKNINFREIFKMVFIGVGLGVHIDEIYKKLNPKTILIVEPELEIFRLSLFTIDYTQFTGQNKKMFFSVGENEEERKKSYTKFYSYQDFINFNIKYYKILDNYDYIYDELTSVFAKNEAVGFPYQLVLENLHKSLEQMKKKERFLSFDLLAQNKILKNKKVLIIAAGPSLDSYIDWIHIHQDKFMIICVDVILRKLEKNGIVPDIVVSIDGSHRCGDYIKTDDPEYLKNSAMVFMSQQDQYTLDVAKNYNKYFSQSVSIVDELGFLGSVPNVGTFSLSVAYFAGANEIYMIGNDAAFDQKTGERYSKDSSWYVKDILDHGSEGRVSEHDVIEVKGNLRETVKTNRNLYRFKEDFEWFITNSNFTEIDLFNLSDGAKIKGMAPKSKEEMDKLILKSEVMKKNILEDMNSVSLIIDSLDFTEDIKIINTVLRKISKYRKCKYKDRDDFLQNKLDLMIWVLEQSKHCGNGVVSKLFLKFTSLADIYVNFVLNLKQNNLHTKEEINIIFQMWIGGLYNLFKDIKKAMTV